VTDLTSAQLATMMNGISAAGATLVRLDVYWSQVEQSPGNWNWTLPDKTIGAALAAGLTPLAILNGAAMPSWATSPPSAAQFTPFVTAAVQHYAAQGVHTYEVWNEPNLGSNWGGTASGSEYAAVLIAAYKAIKAADASSFVISGGLSPASNDGTDVSPQTFLTEMYAAGAGGYFDAVGVHPYCFPADPTDSSSASWNFFYNLPNWIYQVMVTNGDGAKKVWMTEFGDPTGTDTSGGAVSLQTQAQQLTDAFNALKQWSWAGPLFWYNWQDGTDPTSIYDNFGLIDALGNAKPALSAFEAEAQGLDTSSSNPPSVPTAPTSLAATVSGSAVTLSWVNPSGAQGDNVYRDGTEVASPGLVTSYLNTNVASGSHTYYVSAFDSTGQGPASNSVTVTVTSIPVAPVNLNYTIDGSTVTLSWVNPSGAEGDNVYRDGTEVASLGLVTSYQDTNVASGSHTYYVTAHNSVGASVPSSSVTVSIVAVPTAPTSLAATVSGSAVTLSWVNPSGAQGDNIYRDGAKIASPGLVTSYQDLNVASGLHTYYVTAYNAVGTSAPSASVKMSCVTRKMHHTLLFRLILG